MFGSVVPLSVPESLLSSPPPHEANNAAVPMTANAVLSERVAFEKAIFSFPCAMK